MTTIDADRAQLQWQLAQHAIELFTHAPRNIRGLVIRGSHGPVRDQLLALLGQSIKLTRVPVNVSEDSLLGSLDITTTLSSGRTTRHAGLLAGSKGALLVTGAERLPLPVQGVLARWLDTPAGRAGPALVLIDESIDDEAGVTDSVLGEHMPVHVEVPDLSLSVLNTIQAIDQRSACCSFADPATDRTAGPAARGTAEVAEDSKNTDVTVADAIIGQITTLAASLGIDSIRAVLQCLSVARCAARQQGRDQVDEDDAALAVQLVLAPRARCAPPHPPEDMDDTEPQEPPPQEDSAPEPPPEQTQAPESSAQETPEPAPDTDELSEQALPDKLIEAANAALPAQLLAALARGQSLKSRHSGRETGQALNGTSGRPVGVRRPRNRRTRRGLNILATLKAAAPMQRLRGADPAGHQRTDLNAGEAAPERPRIRTEDLRITRFRQPVRTTTVFVVDASGSAALNRLAEAKGAVELLLAECYVRRDRVALVSFRGSSATLDLPPTRSLTRAKRCLSGLPGGGGTPLAAGFDLAGEVMRQLQQAGEIPVGVFMTDGKANIARDGAADRRQAMDDAEHSAQTLAALGARLLLIDTGPRSRAATANLAALMQARYLPLPQARGHALPAILAQD